MRVAFDARMAFHSGIGSHIRGLLGAMNYMPNPPSLTLLGDLNELTRHHFHQNFKVRRFVDPIYSPWRQYRFPRSLDIADVLHVPHYNIPFRYEDPLIVTVHDLIHLRFPEHLGSSLKVFYSRYTFRKVASQAKVIVSVSEYTRQDIMERLGVEADRIQVIPNAVCDTFQPTGDRKRLEAFRKKHKLPQEYLLAVGIDKPHKNHAFLLRSLAPLWESGRLEAPLVFVGADVEKGSLGQTVAAMGLADRVISPGWIEAIDMPLIYQAASLLVFPSLYEGFGLPVIEAQRVGLPVVASNAASIPEAGGAEGAVYFAPDDEAACGQAVLDGLSDTELRKRLIRAGHDNEKRFSWKASAESLVKIYKALPTF